MKVLEVTEKVIFQTPTKMLVAGIFSIMLLKTGIWYIPNLHTSLDIAINPFISHSSANYLMWNWLSPFLAWTVGIKDFFTFFIFHLLFSISFTAIYIYLAFTKLSERSARISLVLFAALPVSGTSYFWVGGDSLTLFLMILSIAFMRNIYVVTLIGIALGMQHFEQSIIATLALFFALVISKYYVEKINCTILFPVALAVGVVIGKLVLIYVFSINEIAIGGTSRNEYFIGNLHALLQSFFFHAHFIIFSILGVGWLIAAKYADHGKYSVSFFVPFFALVILALLVADQTRVLAIVTFYLICVFWLFNENFIGKITNQYAATILLLWVMVPWFWVWVGDPRGSALPYDVAYLLQKSLGLFGGHQISPLWPFRPLWPI